MSLTFAVIRSIPFFDKVQGSAIACVSCPEVLSLGSNKLVAYSSRYTMSAPTVNYEIMASESDNVTFCKPVCGEQYLVLKKCARAQFCPDPEKHQNTLGRRSSVSIAVLADA